MIACGPDVEGCARDAPVASHPVYALLLGQTAPARGAVDRFCARFLDDADRAALRAAPRLSDRRSLSRAVVRWLVTRQLRVPASAVQFDWARPGKPRLRNDVAHFSVSYSADTLLVAISGDGPLGADVEVRRPRCPERLLARICNEREQATLPFAPPSARRAALLHLWTAKEAVAKATGDGLAAPMAAIDIATVLKGGAWSDTARDRDGRTWNVDSWAGDDEVVSIASGRMRAAMPGLRRVTGAMLAELD